MGFFLEKAAKVTCVILSFVLVTNLSLFAQDDAKKLASEINKDLRTVQKYIFGGDTEDAQAMIPDVEAKSRFKILEKNIKQIHEDYISLPELILNPLKNDSEPPQPAKNEKKGAKTGRIT